MKMDCNLPCQQLINVCVSGRIDLVGESIPESSWGPAPQLDALPCASLWSPLSAWGEEEDYPL